MNDFTLETQGCVMQFKMNIKDKLVTIEVTSWSSTLGIRSPEISVYIDLSLHEVKFLRDSLDAFIRKIEGKNESCID